MRGLALCEALRSSAKLCEDRRQRLREPTCSLCPGERPRTPTYRRVAPSPADPRDAGCCGPVLPTPPAQRPFPGRRLPLQRRSPLACSPMIIAPLLAARPSLHPPRPLCGRAYCSDAGRRSGLRREARTAADAPAGWIAPLSCHPRASSRQASPWPHRAACCPPPPLPKRLLNPAPVAFGREMGAATERRESRDNV